MARRSSLVLICIFILLGGLAIAIFVLGVLRFVTDAYDDIHGSQGVDQEGPD